GVCLSCAARRMAQTAAHLVYTFTKPWSDGTMGIRLTPLELVEKLAALVPLPRVHLVCYGGCLAPHSTLREAIRPTPRQQRLDGAEAHPGTPYWPWVRLLGRVFGLDMTTCPFCRRGTLRLILAANFSPMPRIAPPPLGRERLGAATRGTAWALSRAASLPRTDREAS